MDNQTMDTVVVNPVKVARVKLTEAERKANKAASDKAWRIAHKDRVNEYSREYHAKKVSEKKMASAQTTNDTADTVSAQA